MKEYMTSRERVHVALNFQIPDRVSLNLGRFPTGIHKKAYIELLKYLEMDEEIIMLDPVQQLVRPSEEILQLLHFDFRYITAKGPAGFYGSIRQNLREGRLWHDLKDEFGVVWSMPDHVGLYMDISHHPLAEVGIDEIASYPFPDGSYPSRFNGIREELLGMRENSPYAISTGIGGVVYEICWYIRGLEKWFIDMLGNPEFLKEVYGKELVFWEGYVFNNVQNIQAGVPPANIIAMYEAAYQCGFSNQ